MRDPTPTDPLVKGWQDCLCPSPTPSAPSRDTACASAFVERVARVCPHHAAQSHVIHSQGTGPRETLALNDALPIERPWSLWAGRGTRPKHPCRGSGQNTLCRSAAALPADPGLPRRDLSYSVTQQTSAVSGSILRSASLRMASHCSTDISLCVSLIVSVSMLLPRIIASRLGVTHTHTHTNPSSFRPSSPCSSMRLPRPCIVPPWRGR